MMLNNDNKNLHQSIPVAISANFIGVCLNIIHKSAQKRQEAADPFITNALKNFSGIYGILFQEKLCAPRGSLHELSFPKDCLT